MIMLPPSGSFNFFSVRLIGQFYGKEKECTCVNGLMGLCDQGVKVGLLVLWNTQYRPLDNA
jgi:hypothetical protein